MQTAWLVLWNLINQTIQALQHLSPNVRRLPSAMCAQRRLQPALTPNLIRVFVLPIRKLSFLAIQNAPSEDSDQTARMRRLV